MAGSLQINVSDLVMQQTWEDLRKITSIIQMSYDLEWDLELHV